MEVRLAKNFLVRLISLETDAKMNVSTTAHAAATEGVNPTVNALASVCSSPQLAIHVAQVPLVTHVKLGVIRMLLVQATDAAMEKESTSGKVIILSQSPSVLCKFPR